MVQEVETKTGDRVRLVVERDQDQVPQVFAYISPKEGGEEQRLLCHSWAVRKSPEGFRQGIHAQGVLLEMDRKVWDSALAEREDMRDRDNLEDIRLVRVYSKGNRFTIDGYTLSARPDRDAWRRIAPYMVEVDSHENEEILAGDHFRGWIVRNGMEREVERLLEVKPPFRVGEGQGG